MRHPLRLFLTLAAIAVLPGLVSADPGARKGFNFSMFSEPVTGAFPLSSPSSPIFLQDGHAHGVALEYTQPIGDGNWSLGYQLGVGLGKETFEWSFGGNSFKDKLNWLNYKAALHVDREEKIGPVNLGCGSGVEYTNTTLNVDNGTTDADGPSYNTLGLNTRLGTESPISDNVSLFADVNNTLGLGWTSEGDSKTNNTLSKTGFNVGLQWIF